MLYPMTSNDNTAAQTLLFPIQELETSGERLKLPFPDLVVQFRLVYARICKEVEAGEITDDFQKQELRKHINNGNKAMIEKGFKPFPIPF